MAREVEKGKWRLGYERRPVEEFDGNSSERKKGALIRYE